MKPNKITAFTIIALTVALFPGSALARKGELSRPYVALHTSLPDHYRDQIQQVLQRKDCHFISGTWVNSSTKLHYRSNATALQGFIDALTKCPGVKLTLRFSSKEASADWAPAKSNWSVFHMPTDGNTFILTLHLGSEIDVSKLYIPVQNRSVDVATAEQEALGQPSSAPVSKRESKPETHPESDTGFQ